MSPGKKSIYRIFFTSQGKGYELYARKVGQGEVYGFVEVEGLLFGERSSIVVDPGEESLRNEFGHVRRLLIPYHAVSRIDEVEREGAGKIFSLPAAGLAEPVALPPLPGKG
jgi:hypothetical protein